jgi:hypothetical protein
MVVLLMQKSCVLQQGVSERPLARAQGQLCDLSKVTDKILTENKRLICKPDFVDPPCCY